MSRRSVRIHGGEDNQGNAAPDDTAHVTTGSLHVTVPGAVDTISGALIIIPSVHAHVHAGRMFSLTEKLTGLTSGGSTDIYISMPSGVVTHMNAVHVSVGGGDVDLVAYENPTVSATGTAATILNTNRFSPNTADTLIYFGPTVTDVGTKLHTWWVPAMPTGQGHSQTGVINAEIGSEWILKTGNTYLYRLTNNGADTISVWFEFLFYETQD